MNASFSQPSAAPRSGSVPVSNPYVPLAPPNSPNGFGLRMQPGPQHAPPQLALDHIQQNPVANAPTASSNQADPWAPRPCALDWRKDNVHLMPTWPQGGTGAVTSSLKRKAHQSIGSQNSALSEQENEKKRRL